MITVNPLPLYKNIGGQSLFENSEPVFQEYRKRWNEQPKQFNHGEFPLFLDLEVTNICNLKCTFCATTYFGPEIKRQLIDPEIVYRVLDEGKSNNLYGVKFNDRGEPLIHPQLVDFIKYAKKCGLVDVYFNTNAMLLDDVKAMQIIESGLDRISISVEGTDAETYEKLRVKGKFDTVVKNVRNFWNLRKSLGAHKPKIRIQSVLLKELEHQLDEYKQFWEPYADEISILEYKEEADVGTIQRGIAYPWACHQLWQRMIVWCDGKILPCNEDDRGLLTLGNIKSMSIKDAWHSPTLQRYRELHKNGNAHKLTACDECYLRNSQINIE